MVSRCTASEWPNLRGVSGWVLRRWKFPRTNNSPIQQAIYRSKAVNSALTSNAWWILLYTISYFVTGGATMTRRCGRVLFAVANGIHRTKWRIGNHSTASIFAANAVVLFPIVLTHMMTNDMHESVNSRRQNNQMLILDRHRLKFCASGYVESNQIIVRFFRIARWS